MSHNYLIGDEIVADGSGNWLVGFDAIAIDDAYSVDEDSTLTANVSVLANDTDDDGCDRQRRFR